MFKIMSISAGWIMGEIGDGEQKHFFDYSYITNFLNDFMETLLCIHGEWEPYAYKDKFRTELEPAIEDWHICREQDKMIINIKNYESEYSDKVEREIYLTFDFYEFMAEFVQEMDRILERYGLVGYRENWSFEFPVGLYLMLKNICKGQNRLAISKLIAEQHFGTDATVSDLDKELKLLREALE